MPSKMAYEEGLGGFPDRRTTNFFIDLERRGEGVASFALREALREMTRLGGGTVEAYPGDYTGQKTSVLSCAACSRRRGSKKARRIAMHRWVVVCARHERK